MDELKVFTGNAHPALAQAIVDYLGMPLGKCEVFQFSNENTFVRILENVRERDVFVVQPFCAPVNNNLV
jgi:ribose-phosphate pyrophosphokinase